MLRIGRLTVENLTKECVTDNPRPRFSYYLESDRENVSLKSAVIRMNGWSTVTEDQVAVPYGGPELEPFTRYAVTVHVTDDAGAGRSETTILHRALLPTGISFSIRRMISPTH